MAIYCRRQLLDNNDGPLVVRHKILSGEIRYWSKNYKGNFRYGSPSECTCETSDAMVFSSLSDFWTRLIKNFISDMLENDMFTALLRDMFEPYDNTGRTFYEICFIDIHGKIINTRCTNKVGMTKERLRAIYYDLL
jgi:hypothetical protein